MSTLRFILGDQLSHKISSLNNCDKQNDIIFMCEVYEEATYVKHHKKKIALIFSAMRHFAQELTAKGFCVDYIELDSRNNTNQLKSELKRAITRHSPTQVIATTPSEYRVFKDLEGSCTILEDTRFLCSNKDFIQWAKDKKQLRMEYFYREMRKKHNILMDNGKPIGGKWNYDQENRKPLKSRAIIPKRSSFSHDEITTKVIALIDKRFSNHFGDIETFDFAVTRKQALIVLNKFIKERLINFGSFQDAMVEKDPWLYHSHISLYLNCGLLLPNECIQKALNAYHKYDIPLNSVEGFIRQILGWREYVRGIYWLKMPNYKDENYLEAKKPLPDFFWTANTDMNCLRSCINDTKKNAYSNHIQRLMVLGNYCLLTGIDPEFVNEWYLVVYADAYEWVELPNVTGMILFADGGLLASKPYAASGAYINKMSDYCKNCKYNVKQKNGEDACPFNYLYWDFLIRNHDMLKSNQRMSLMLSKIKTMKQEKIDSIKNDTEVFFQKLDKGEV